MGGKPILFASLALALAAQGSLARAAERAKKCEIATIAEMPTSMVGMKAQTKTKVDGQDLTFTVDSGSFFSFMAPETAQRLKLPTQMAPFGYYVKGVGGSDNRVDIATSPNFKLGAIDVPNVPFLVIPGIGGGSMDGILGQNVLSLFDTEYDLGNGVIRILKPSADCAHALPAYWAKPDQFVAEVGLEPISREQSHLKGVATINGQKVNVTFDTGASSSVLKLSTAERLGFKVGGPGVRARGAAHGIGPRAIETWTAPFDSFEVGGEKILHTELQVGALELNRADMLLGADFFLSHRIYVSKQQRKMYFTYNGGPVFHLQPPSGVRTAEAETQARQSAPAAPDAHSDAPTDAAGFARRAQASMSRRDFPAAVADFTRAIQLEPNEARHYVQRGDAHLSAGEAVLAMGDFDQALKLKPADPAALIGRGRLYLISHDLARGQADLDAAVKADPDAAMAAGAIYANNQQFALALADFDLWIDRHKDADNIANPLMNRCRMRVLWNRDLDKALTDCEAAIRKGPRTAVMYETRGLTHLRRGEADAAIADFKEALNRQPQLPWSLYGRALAERSKGQTQAADADVAAGKALAPRLPETLKRYGFDIASSAAPTAKAGAQ